MPTDMSGDPGPRGQVAGYTSLRLAIAADTGTTLIVIANALRLLRVSRH